MQGSSAPPSAITCFVIAFLPRKLLNSLQSAKPPSLEVMCALANCERDRLQERPAPAIEACRGGGAFTLIRKETGTPREIERSVTWEGDRKLPTCRKRRSAWQRRRSCKGVYNHSNQSALQHQQTPATLRATCGDVNPYRSGRRRRGRLRRRSCRWRALRRSSMPSTVAASPSSSAPSSRVYTAFLMMGL